MAYIEQEVTDQEIKNLMEQYSRIVRLIKEDCIKRGIVFGGYGYFRKGDSVANPGTYAMSIGTELHAYDKWWMERDFTLSFLEL